ncbi:hypothetical protein, variant [Phialophora macrospora]|uniref:Fungal lipase-type domain-containing protein n=1 Tax=Phialophora macrospora TaxID=1851006 RepID=A0A0D2FV61_9EURO|nr:hypothetical protein PV04_02663 [Phialophora macrospora]KIW70391.1 hypothetical protein, variant [Phialophora macrospora]
MSDSDTDEADTAVTPGIFRRLPTFAYRTVQRVGVGIGRFFQSCKDLLARGVRWSTWRTLQQTERLFWRNRTSRRGVRAGARSAAITTGAVPADSARTSAGASRAMVEILQTIEEAYDSGKGDGIWSDLIDRLDAVTQACSNGDLPQDTAEYTFTEEQFNLVRLAAQCSKLAYDTPPSAVVPVEGGVQVPPSTIVPLDEVVELSRATKDGMVKASSMMVHQSHSRRCLVVAVRGTASLVDWLVNLDGDPEPVDNFLCRDSPTTAAHAGLLRVAKQMCPAICSKVTAQLDAYPLEPPLPLPDLVLTGHSAGGGVAALLCAHIRQCRPDIQRQVRQIHCITFAAPPVFAPLEAVSDVAATSPDGAVTLAIVHFGDIVPRAETEYIRSLLRLYAERAEDPSDEPWEFGAPTLFNHGQIVVLKDVAENDREDDVRAFQPSQEVWQNVAFGSVAAHSMDGYLMAIEAYERSTRGRPG